VGTVALYHTLLYIEVAPAPITPFHGEESEIAIKVFEAAWEQGAFIPMKEALQENQHAWASHGARAAKPGLLWIHLLPGVCRMTLFDISIWLDEPGPDVDTLNTVLITVAPERDTADGMTEYVS